MGELNGELNTAGTGMKRPILVGGVGLATGLWLLESFSSASAQADGFGLTAAWPWGLGFGGYAHVLRRLNPCRSIRRRSIVPKSKARSPRPSLP
ncbi:MAG: hypothetical protein HC857_10375 [Synechococcales cyanobacterium RU_4_20]|nr:hypothetical protein [Synechococcales cyanobacterium RU_4_20]